jgi:TonB family protein
MGASWGSRFLAAVGLLVLTAAVAFPQQFSTEDSKRKIKSKVNPQYSDLARRMNLTGKVKIEMVIAPDGRVKNARALGGHPVLVQSCMDVVKDWKFEPGPEETIQIIEFDFHP